MRVQVNSNDPTTIYLVPDDDDLSKIAAAIALVRTQEGQTPTRILLLPGTVYGIPMLDRIALYLS